MLQPFKILARLSVLLAFIACSDKDDEPKGDGGITFWTSDIASYGNFINVVINGESRQITLSWPSLPDCEQTQGTAYFKLPQGIYSYTITDGHGKAAAGSVNVFENECFNKRL